MDTAFTVALSSHLLRSLKKADLENKIRKLQDYVVDLSDDPVRIAGDEVVTNVVNGIFVAPEINWQEVYKKLGDKYKVEDKEVETQIVTDLKLGKICPPKTITRDFSGDKAAGQVIDPKTVYCQAVIKLKTESMPQQEIPPFLAEFFEKQKVLGNKADTILAWLKEPGKRSGGDAFYSVVSFKIFSSFNVKRYLKAKLRTPQKFEKKIQKMTDEELKEANKQIDADLEKEVTDVAIELSELIAEKLVYADLVQAFKDLGASPFVQFDPKKWNLNLTAEPVNADSVKLGEKIIVNVTVENLTKYTDKKLKLGEDFGIRVNSTYFAIADKGTIGEAIGSGKSLKTSLLLAPNIQEIIKQQEKPNYAAVIELFDIKSDFVLDRERLKIKFEKPSLELTITRPFLPYKGQHFELKFKFNADFLEDVPVKITGLVGPDFKYADVDSSSGIFNDTFTITQKGFERSYTLVANRAGFPGYKNTAFFRVFVGEWACPVDSRTLSFTVLPNLLDTSIAGLTAFAGILSAFYPNLVPSLTAEPNIATLSSTAAVVYLGFRALSWGLATQKT